MKNMVGVQKTTIPITKKGKDGLEEIQKIMSL